MQLRLKISPKSNSLSGKYIYVVHDDGSVNVNGVPLSGDFTAIPLPPTDVTLTIQ